MFTPDHKIWKFANAAGELDNWLPHAEYLVGKWSSQSCDEVTFEITWQIIIASLLLMDDLLPASARGAYAKVMLEIINEADTNKLRVNCLHIHPPKPGRKEDRAKTLIRFHEVNTLIQDGKSATEAYKVVAEKHFKSPDTIRREYERFIKKMRKRKKPGEIKK